MLRFTPALPVIPNIDPPSSAPLAATRNVLITTPSKIVGHVDQSRIRALSIAMSDRLGTELSAQAAEVLGRHGYRARVNEVGHVAIALA